MPAPSECKTCWQSDCPSVVSPSDSPVSNWTSSMNCASLATRLCTTCRWRRGSIYGLYGKWRESCREGGYRILHGHTARTAMVCGLAARMTGVPMVYHAHSPASHDTAHRWRDQINGFIERQSLRRATRVIAVSQAMAEHIASEGFDPARITVVPNGVPGAMSCLLDRGRLEPGPWAWSPCSGLARGSKPSWKRWPSFAGGDALASAGRGHV